jgi:ferredoxin/flavodoxin
MILFFSGTGNSRYVAEQIAQVTGDELLSINKMLKAGESPAFSSPNAPFVIVSPTYAWRLPRVVEKFLRKARLTGSREAYFLLTCGSDAGAAPAHCRRLCKAMGLTLAGFAQIVMPENYVAMYPVPEEKLARRMVAKATPAIRELAAKIRDGQSFHVAQPSTPVQGLKSGLVNSLFYPAMVSAKGFYATDACVGCGKCVELCPLNNVSLPGGRPQWGDACTHCMACISGCPTKAIEYKNKSQGKPRYFLPAGTRV